MYVCLSFVVVVVVVILLQMIYFGQFSGKLIVCIAAAGVLFMKNINRQRKREGLLLQTQQVVVLVSLHSQLISKYRPVLCCCPSLSSRGSLSQFKVSRVVVVVVVARKGGKKCQDWPTADVKVNPNRETGNRLAATVGVPRRSLL